MAFIEPTLAPISKAVVHNTAITAAADILAAALSIGAGRDVALLRIEVCVGTGGAFSARVTRAGVTISANFNSGSALTADALYVFDLFVHSGDSVNFRHSADATLSLLRVHEVGAQAS